MKSLQLTLATILTLNSLVATAGPRDEARVAIDQSHVAARLMSQEYLRQDLGSLIQVIVQTPPPSPLVGASLNQQVQKMNEKVLSQLAKMDSLKNYDVTQLNDLVASYRFFVRERLRVSFEAQDLVYQQQLAVRAFEIPFEGFATLCRSGRSAKNTIGEIGSIPRIPDNQYSFNMSYGMNTSSSGSEGFGGHPNQFSFQSSGSNQAIKDRNTVNAVLGSASGISWSIAFSGGSGAAVSGALVAAPYLAAAFLAYSAVNYIMSNDEEIALKNEMAKAQADLFLKSATDRDVAAYYKESCAGTLVKMQPLLQTIKDFSTSDLKRDEISQQIEATRSERQTYKENALKTLPARNLLTLAGYVRQNICEDAKFAHLCKKSGNAYVLTQNPSVRLDLKSETDKQAVEAARQEMIAFDKSYPQDVVLKYVAYETLDTLYYQWNDISYIVANAGLSSLDQAMNILANKLQFIVMETQKANNSPWSKSTRLLNTEIKLQTEFFELREEYFRLLTDALKIFFNKGNADQGKVRFKAFDKKFNMFSGKTITSPDVQSMAHAVSRLGKFYEQL